MPPEHAAGGGRLGGSFLLWRDCFLRNQDDVGGVDFGNSVSVCRVHGTSNAHCVRDKTLSSHSLDKLWLEFMSKTAGRNSDWTVTVLDGATSIELYSGLN